MPDADYSKFESFSVLDFKVFILLFMSAVDGEIHPAEIEAMQRHLSKTFKINVTEIGESIEKVCAHFDTCNSIAERFDSINFACVQLKNRLKQEELKKLYILCETVSSSDNEIHPKETDVLNILSAIWGVQRN